MKDVVIESHGCNWELNLGAAVEHQRALDQQIVDIVRHARAEHGASWADVANLIGVTRQAARQRFGRLEG